LKLEHDLTTVTFARREAVDELRRFVGGPEPGLADVGRCDAHEAR